MAEEWRCYWEMLEFESEASFGWGDPAERLGGFTKKKIGSVFTQRSSAEAESWERERERLLRADRKESIEAEEDEEGEEDEAEALSHSLSISEFMKKKNSEKYQKAPDQPIRCRHVPFHLGSNGHLSASLDADVSHLP